jgi:signal transduction histidine kinase
MPETEQGSLLLLPVLASIGADATATDVEERMAAAGATLSPGTAESVLAELSRLGLVRVTQTAADGRHFVATSIGQRRLDDGLLGERDEAERLAELEQLRTDLLSTIAHELRTPLTAVRTSIGLLQDPDHAPDADQRKTLLDTIDRNALRMQRLVGDILDLARFRAGSIQLQLRRFDANELAMVAVTSIAPLAEAAGQTIELLVDDGPAWVFGDYRRLEQALINLISNAQKFSPRGAVVNVDVSQKDGDIRWTVTDRGPGISEEDQARLFERFFVGPGDRPSGGQGVGLGLPTALAIAQAHEGTIEVKSALGEGSTFSLVVPAEGPEPGAEL